MGRGSLKGVCYNDGGLGCGGGASGEPLGTVAVGLAEKSHGKREGVLAVGEKM